ncbi:MAG: sigma-70 family RNA polymerase sigma factor [Actinomycetes bacterium]
MSDPTTLAQVLESLPEEERIILTLHYLKSMTSVEIATMLNVPARSVEGVISSGKARLTAILGL